MKASIDIDRHLPLQAISFRGQDESFTSTNRENFLTTLDLILGYNNNVVEIMTKAPKQKCHLYITSYSKRNSTCYFNQSEIGDAKFCILVDEAHDDGFMQEQFYGIAHSVETAPLTLKKEIYYLFSNHCLDIQNI